MSQAETSQRKEMEAALEAVLFVSPEPVTRTRLLGLFPERDREAASEALDVVIARYSSAGEDGRGVMIEEVAGGVRLITRPEMNDWLRRFFESGIARKLSMGALETLAIIAYRQPVTAPEIQELRSVSPAGVLKTLLERRMIRIAGRKEVVGKPFLYATTQEFLLHFGLKNLKDLPPLEEFEEALAAEGLGELLGGTDHEEEVLREAAELEEREHDLERRGETDEELVDAEESMDSDDHEIGDPNDEPAIGDPEDEDPEIDDPVDPAIDDPVPDDPPPDPVIIDDPVIDEPPDDSPEIEEPQMAHEDDPKSEPRELVRR